MVKRYGSDGTRYGEAGYNTLTNTDLWPWSNEDRIKADMSAVSTRGFCASGQTLTKYIWEYLGNTIPPEIYGGSAVGNKASEKKGQEDTIFFRALKRLILGIRK